MDGEEHQRGRSPRYQRNVQRSRGGLGSRTWAESPPDAHARARSRKSARIASPDKRAWSAHRVMTSKNVSNTLADKSGCAQHSTICVKHVACPRTSFGLSPLWRRWVKPAIRLLELLQFGEFRGAPARVRSRKRARIATPAEFIDYKTSMITD